MPGNIHINEVAGHLFRHEAGKLVAVLTKIFGAHNLHLAEDVMQDTLLRALENWRQHGVPDNPTGWLFRVARNKAIDVIRREGRTVTYDTAIDPLLHSEYSLVPAIDGLLQEDSIADDQLRMMFTCCHPSLSLEAQVALILKTLCGLSVAEIARVFITGTDTIEKRLYRARQQFREHKVAFEIPQGTILRGRLDSVLTAVYFIFNEGYAAAQHESLIRRDMLEESLRLAGLLAAHPQTKDPKVLALMALICFNSARNDARLDDTGNILLLHEQDRTLWNRELIARGIAYLETSAGGDEISTYHLQAMIAYEHSVAPDFVSTNWTSILSYYDLLYRINPSPIVALNRAIVLGELYGPQQAIDAIAAISSRQVLEKYYLLPATLGELYCRLGNREKAIHFLQQALTLTQGATEIRLLENKLEKAAALNQNP